MNPVFVVVLLYATVWLVITVLDPILTGVLIGALVVWLAYQAGSQAPRSSRPAPRRHQPRRTTPAAPVRTTPAATNSTPQVVVKVDVRVNGTRMQ